MQGSGLQTKHDMIHCQTSHTANVVRNNEKFYNVFGATFSTIY